jgi:hypothetical protein
MKIKVNGKTIKSYNKDKSINENFVAIMTSVIEGKKKQTNIAQIMEVQTVTMRVLSVYDDYSILNLVDKHRLNYGSKNIFNKLGRFFIKVGRKRV